ncbi:MAG: efflux RND transporter periplasmic adaptor subunit [Bradymonadia bacterium]
MATAPLLCALFALTCLASGCASKDPDKAASKAKGKGPPPARVEVTTTRAGTLTDTRSYLGQVQPVHAVTLAPAVAGTVSEVVGRPGDQVKADQVLVRLDTDLIVPEIAAARATESEVTADLAQARRDLRRARKRAHPIVTDAERERYQAAVERLSARLDGAKATRRRLQASRDRHQLVAPFSGVIRARMVEPGAWIAAGSPAFQLVSADEVEIIVEVAPDLPVKQGAGATLHHDGSTAEATIAGVIPALESATRAQRLRLQPVGERPQWLLPGMAVGVRFSVQMGTSESVGGVLLPRDALVRGPTGVRVMKVIDGKGVPIPVHVLADADDTVLVKVPEGLTPPSAPPLPNQASAAPPEAPSLAVGDQVVIRGNERLRPGQALKIMSEIQAAGGPEQ